MAGILKVKAGDEWVDIPAIVGPQGVPGVPGPQGLPGPKGDPGDVQSVAGKTGAVTLDAGDVAYDESASYADGTVGAGLADLKSHVTTIDNSVAKFIEDGEDALSSYYKHFNNIKSGQNYVLRVTTGTSGTYTLAFGTYDSAEYLVDTVYSGEFTANVPKDIQYTPSGNYGYARLWMCDDWDIEVYQYPSIWDAIDEESALITEANNAITNALDLIKNNNLIDEEHLILNQRYNESGTLVGINGWTTTNAIPVEANKTYYFSFADSGVRAKRQMWYLILFNSDKSSVLDFNNSGVLKYTPNYDGIIHFTWKNAETKTNFFCGTIANPDYYDVFGYTVVAKRAKELYPKPYNSVVWACVGDSMTEANTKAARHYFDYISEELGIQPLNYGVSGTGYAAKMTQAAGEQAFFQRIPNITDSFDILTIFGSVNDIGLIGSGSGQLPLGTYESSGTTTIGGCINAAIDAFYALAPLKKIGIISQPPSLGTANNGHLIGTTAQDYNDLLQQICKNRSIPFLDLFNCSGLRPWDSDFREEYYKENGVQDPGVHPNSEGQKILSTKIREFLLTMI